MCLKTQHGVEAKSAKKGCHHRLEAVEDVHDDIYHVPLSPPQVTPGISILFAAIYGANRRLARPLKLITSLNNPESS